MIFRLTEIDSKVLLILDFAWIGLTHINGDENVRSILLSGRPEVQILLATPESIAASHFWWFAAFFVDHLWKSGHNKITDTIARVSKMFPVLIDEIQYATELLPVDEKLILWL